MQLYTKKFIWIVSILTSLFILGACSATPDVPTLIPVEATATLPPAETSAALPTGQISDSQLADVLSVKVSGDQNAYQFSVEIRSPDTGCQQYADWWEVVSEQGELVYRRILAHSHVAEQPFTRSGGPVAIPADTVVILRAHMHPGGYGGAALRGSVAGGFETIQLEPGFATHLSEDEPQPAGCGF